MARRVRCSRWRLDVRRFLILETLHPRLLFASDLGCTPVSMLSVGASDPPAVHFQFGPVVDLHQQQHIALPNGVRLDTRGLAYSYLPPPQPADGELAMSMSGSGEGGQSGGGGGGFAGSGPVVPSHSSKPSASKKIYLDFDGHVVTGTTWNNQNYTGSYDTGAVINAPAYSIDADRSTFNAQELTTIREIWARMAEDFAPFQVDVTTVFPGEQIFLQGGNAIRVLISTDVDATTNTQWFPPAGGVAYLNSWNFTNGSPVWVFYNRLGASNSKNNAEAGSHEVGHAFNLQHDGRTSPTETYYRGHGSGQTGWAPIMGVGYDRPLVQWSRGEYPNANQTQDDLAIISGNVPYEPDDHGNTSATATLLTATETGAVTSQGLVTTRTDVDAFRFFTQTGSVTLNGNPFELSTGKSNLDVQLTVLNALGNTVAVVNDTATLNATITTNLTKGFYTAIIDGIGRAASGGDSGYSDYASIGWYTFSGSLVPNSIPVVNATSTFVVAYEGELLTNSGTWSDPNPDDTVTLTASVGTIQQFANGTWAWSMPTTEQFTDLVVTITATDDLGGVGTRTFTVSAENRPPVLTVGQANVAGNVLSMLTNSGTWADVSADTVTLSASLGTVTRNTDGTWSWSFVPSQAYANETVTITATDEDGGSSQIQFTMDAIVAVVNGMVYYKGSSFAGTSVDAALDTSKVIAKSGTTAQTLSFTNLINTTRGINGLVFDVAGLASTSLTAADFGFRMSPSGSFDEATNPPSAWTAAPAPTLVDVTPGTASKAARVRLEWADRAIENRWLQVKVLANANTGLTTPQVYYVGHLYGEVNGTVSSGSFSVSISDATAIRPFVGSAATVASPFDLDKSGSVSIGDITGMRPRVGVSVLRAITIPPSGSSDEGEGAARLEFAPLGSRQTRSRFDVPLPKLSWDHELSLDLYFARLSTVADLT